MPRRDTMSTGGLMTRQQIPAAPGYQVPFAAALRSTTGVPTLAVGMITEASRANDIIERGDADMVALARGMLYDPRWAWHAADALGAEASYPLQYRRAWPAARADAFGERDRV